MVNRQRDMSRLYSTLYAIIGYTLLDDDDTSFSPDMDGLVDNIVDALVEARIVCGECGNSGFVIRRMDDGENSIVWCKCNSADSAWNPL